MTALALILFPILMAAAAALVPSRRFRPWLLPVGGAVHLALVLLALVRPAPVPAALGRWLALDPPAAIVMLTFSTLIFFCSFHAVGYLRRTADLPNRVFCVCYLALPGLMSLVSWSQHLGLLWVGVEATTLVTAPLIYHERTPLSIEATWKYMMVCSVGIGLGLLGTFCLAYAGLDAGLGTSLLLGDLLRDAPALSKPWLHAAFILMLVGYGAKMGLAPMHTWLPDAHSEAPAPVSAILSGALLPCAFLAIIRIRHIGIAAGETAFASRPLVWIGLFSMAVACVFLIGQRDFKRMLAYSSVEHMGILALGLGLGAAAIRGTMLHVLVHGLTKGALFLAAGNIYHAFHSRSTDKVGGALRHLPLSGGLFLAGFFAITGSPPFAPFISEFAILNGAFGAGRPWVGALFLLLLLLVFVGMGATVLKIVQGRPSEAAAATPCRENFLAVAPSVGLMVLVLILGLWIPVPLAALLEASVRFLEATP